MLIIIIYQTLNAHYKKENLRKKLNLVLKLLYSLNYIRIH